MTYIERIKGGHIMPITRNARTGQYIVHAKAGTYAFLTLREAQEFVALHPNA